jgi:hypothetical protein
LNVPDLPDQEGPPPSALAVTVRRHVDATVAGVDPVTADEARSRVAQRRPRWAGPLLAAAAVLAAVAVGVAVAGLLESTEDATVVDTAGAWPLTIEGHRDWLLAIINGEHEPDDAELRARLDETFLQAVSPESFRAATRQITPLGPWTVATEVERRDAALALQLLAGDGEQQARLSLALADDGRLAGALVLLASSCSAELVEPASVELAPALGERLDWLLDGVADGRTPSDEELAAVMDPAFLQALPGDEMRTALAEVAALAPLTLRWYEGSPGPTELTARVGIVSGEEARLRLSIEPGPPHRITGASVLTREPCGLTLARGNAGPAILELSSFLLQDVDVVTVLPDLEPRTGYSTGADFGVLSDVELTGPTESAVAGVVRQWSQDSSRGGDGDLWTVISMVVAFPSPAEAETASQALVDSVGGDPTQVGDALVALTEPEDGMSDGIVVVTRGSRMALVQIAFAGRGDQQLLAGLATAASQRLR